MIWGKIQLKFNNIIKFGLLNVFMCVGARVKLSILRLYFGFNKWHVSSNYKCTPYKQKIVTALDMIESNGLVDLGCGLGDIGIILRKNNSKINYYGLDRKVNAIKAAEFISRQNNNKFSIGSFESLKLLDADDYNTLLVINLAHRHDSKSLVELIMSNISVNIRYLLIDAIHIEESHNYAHKHTANKLIDLGLKFKLISKVKNIDKYRDLFVFERESLNV